MDLSDLYHSLGNTVPEMIVAFFGLLVFTLDFASPRMDKKFLSYIGVGGLLAASIPTAFQIDSNIVVYSGGYTIDTFAVFFKFLFYAVGIMVLLSSIEYNKIHGVDKGEYPALVIFATLGLMVMASASDFIMFFVGLELASISAYVLAAFTARHDKKTSEAAVKYFLMGAVSAAVILYAISLVYGVTGEIAFSKIARVLAEEKEVNYILLAAAMMFLVGFAFKIGAVPLHMYVPDVYQGAPTPVAGFISTAPKAAAIAVMLRIFLTVLGSLKMEWGIIMAVMAALSMTLGNFLALREENVKRLLAFSGIANTGYVLVGFAAAAYSSRIGFVSVMLYFMFYALANIGAFSILVLVCREERVGETLDEIRGLSLVSPWAAAMFAIFVFSLAGIPPTTGFLAKFWVISAALESHLTWLAWLTVFNAVISAYYYLKLVVAVYFQPVQEGNDLSIISSTPLKVAITVMAILTVYFGLRPGIFFDMAQQSFKLIL